MQIVENQTDNGVVLTLDDKHFVNCRYKGCTLVYGGGDYALTNTIFENCPLTLNGPAQRTASLLANFGVLPPQSGTSQGPQGGPPKKGVN
jgi:hypothetical protein